MEKENNNTQTVQVKKKVGRPLGWRKQGAKKKKSYRLSLHEEAEVNMLLATLRNKDKKKFQFNTNFDSVFLFPDTKAPEGKLYSDTLITDLRILESDPFAPLEFELVDILEETKFSYVVKPSNCRQPFKIDKKTLKGQKKEKAKMSATYHYFYTYQQAYRYFLAGKVDYISLLFNSLELDTRKHCIEIMLDKSRYEALDYIHRLYWHLNPLPPKVLDEEEELALEYMKKWEDEDEDEEEWG